MSIQSLKKQALELSEKKRAELAHLLIDSLHSDEESISEEEWADELKSRIEQYEQGQSPTRSWNMVKENAQSRLKK